MQPFVSLSICLSLCFIPRRLKDDEAKEVDVSRQPGQVYDIILYRCHAAEMIQDFSLSSAK